MPQLAPLFSPHAGPRRVLVVDDDPGIRHLVWQILRQSGVPVVSASSTAVAEQRLGAEPFGLLVTDYSMPHETGVEFVTRLRAGMTSALPCNVSMPVLAMTATRDEQVYRAFLAQGVLEVLDKPFRPRVLIDAVQRAVGGGQKIAPALSRPTMGA